MHLSSTNEGFEGVLGDGGAAHLVAVLHALPPGHAYNHQLAVKSVAGVIGFDQRLRR
jgi:hypothetical protein